MRLYPYGVASTIPPVHAQARQKGRQTFRSSSATQCNTQNEWQANGAANAQQDFVSADATLGHALASAASTVDDYYNGMSVTIVAGAGLSEESGIFGAVVGFTLTLQASQSHWANDANYYTGFAISVCSAACDGLTLPGPDIGAGASGCAAACACCPKR